MDNKSQTKYIDADVLLANIWNCMPSMAINYSGDPVSNAIDQKLSAAINSSFSHFIANLSTLIISSAKPYENDKCMLCKQRDWDIKPDCDS